MTRQLTCLTVLPVFALFLFFAPVRVSAALAPEQVCDTVARMASQQTGVPVSVLQAITRTETGRKSGGRFGPWPWTVNMEGKGVWFDTLDEARAYVFRHFKRGARSFDVGCFQINYKWHHKGFSSIDEMFDPSANALYAARFLMDLYKELGDWSDAAGAYHSRTPKFANRYKAVFNKHRRNVPDTAALATAQPAPRATPPRKTRINTYPLLQTGGGRQLGSLVPIGTRSGNRGLIDMTRPAQTRLIGG